MWKRFLGWLGHTQGLSKSDINRHQDEVVDVASLNLERVISVGARDRTARLW